MHPPAFAIGRVSAVGLCLLLASLPSDGERGGGRQH
jgi:hypothetical protein